MDYLSPLLVTGFPRHGLSMRVSITNKASTHLYRGRRRKKGLDIFGDFTVGRHKCGVRNVLSFPLSWVSYVRMSVVCELSGRDNF